MRSYKWMPVDSGGRQSGSDAWRWAEALARSEVSIPESQAPDVKASVQDRQSHPCRLCAGETSHRLEMNVMARIA
jgi:hypothetical protein